MEGAIANSGAVNIADLGAGACSGAGAAPTFHIPESNASDFAPSECSSHYRKGKHIYNCGHYYNNIQGRAFLEEIRYTIVCVL